MVLKKHIENGAPAGNAADTASVPAPSVDNVQLFAAMQDIVEVVAAKAGVSDKDPAAKLFVEQFQKIKVCWQAIEEQERGRQLEEDQRASAQLQQSQRLSEQPGQQTTQPGASSQNHDARGAQPAVVGAGEGDDAWMGHIADLTGGSIESLSEEQRAAAAAIAKLRPQDQESFAKRLKVS